MWQTWFAILAMGLSGLMVAFTLAVILLPHNRALNWLTRPVRARFWVGWNDMSYKQAYAALRLMDIRDRRLHR